MYTLALVHIGSSVPQHLYDCVYQFLVVNEFSSRIMIILDDDHIETFYDTIKEWNLDLYTSNEAKLQCLVTCIPVSTLDKVLEHNENWDKYRSVMKEKYAGMVPFRDGFWMSTTSRFFYLAAMMSHYKIQNVFHIENDVMLYCPLDQIANYVPDLEKICVVQDAPHRVVPSIVYAPSADVFNNLCSFIASKLSLSTRFLNDMELLAIFPDKTSFPLFPSKVSKKETALVFDGAAIGQYLGGIDVNNIKTKDRDNKGIPLEFSNPTRGFVNETSVLKPSDLVICPVRVTKSHKDTQTQFTHLHKQFVCRTNDSNVINSIANLHIHSKQLYQFSSVFNLSYDDFITGDNVIKLCDFVFATREIHKFHKGLDEVANDVIIVNDFQKINTNLLQRYILDYCTKSQRQSVKLFLYTHILDNFIKYILPHLPTTKFSPIEYIIYVHNSDHSFDDQGVPSYKALLDDEKVSHVYAQNVNIPLHNKTTLLPIGIANKMWPHGDLTKLYTVAKDTYMRKKDKAIYVNLNTSTFAYRQNVIDAFTSAGHKIASGKLYIDYLKDLSSHRFCLCVRGNGIDTHRMWEALYLGVVPVIINNKHTRMNYFVDYLRNQGIPFVEINDDDLENAVKNKYTEELFSEAKYKSMIHKSKSFLQSLTQLKVGSYKFE